MARVLYVIAAAALLALSITPASAQVHGTIGGDYTNISGDASGDTWSVGGAGIVNLGWNNLNLQGDAGYSDSDGASIWGLSGSLLWRDMNFVAGANIGYAQADADFGASVDLVTYGLLGDLYAGDNFTLGARGGWFSGDEDVDGTYISGYGTWYVTPDIGVTPSISHTDVSGSDVKVTSYGIGGEWLIDQMSPVSIYARYAHEEFDAGPFDASGDAWTIGINLYLGDGTASLVQHHRTNALSSASPVSLGTAFRF